jgi:hypothetical protein
MHAVWRAPSLSRTDAPTLTGSMRIALANLQLEHLTVVYPGKQSL